MKYFLTLALLLTLTIPVYAATDHSKQLSTLNNKALKFFRAESLDEAIAAWNEAAEIVVENGINSVLAAEVLNNLGYGYYKQTDYQNSEKWLLISKDIAPDRWSVYLNLGDLYFDLNQCSDYIINYKLVPQKKPEYKYKGKLKKKIAAARYNEESKCKDILAVGHFSNCGKFYGKVNLFEMHSLDYYLNIHGQYIKDNLGWFYSEGRIKSISSRLIRTFGDRRLYQLGSEVFILYLYEMKPEQYIPLSLEIYCGGPKFEFTELGKDTLFSTTPYADQWGAVRYNYLFDEAGKIVSSFTQEEILKKVFAKIKGMDIERPGCIADLDADSRCFTNVKGEINCYYMLKGSYKPRDGNMLASIVYKYSVDRNGVKILSSEIDDMCYLTEHYPDVDEKIKNKYKR